MIYIYIVTPLKKEGIGGIPLGYSGRTALRREQCEVLPESGNIGVGMYGYS
jgi:hypothetical protein